MRIGAAVIVVCCLVSSPVMANEDIVEAGGLYFDVYKPQKIGDRQYRIFIKGSSPNGWASRANVHCANKTVGWDVRDKGYKVYSVTEFPSMNRIIDKVCKRPWYKF